MSFLIFFYQTSCTDASKRFQLGSPTAEKYTETLWQVLSPSCLRQNGSCPRPAPSATAKRCHWKRVSSLILLGRCSEQKSQNIGTIPARGRLPENLWMLSFVQCKPSLLELYASVVLSGIFAVPLLWRCRMTPLGGWAIRMFMFIA
jgi:hypothetical protein